MTFKLCHHIKSDGKRCRAAALKSESWCFFHRRLHVGKRNIRYSPWIQTLPLETFELPPLEDMQSVQVMASFVMQAVAANLIRDSKANALLKGIEKASREVSGRTSSHATPGIIRECASILAKYGLIERDTNDGSPVPG